MFEDKLNRIINPTNSSSMSIRQPGFSMNTSIDERQIKDRLRQALSNIPELEKAQGKIDIKFKGHKSRTITFTIR